jgi:predicted nucleic acid-binding protein
VTTCTTGTGDLIRLALDTNVLVYAERVERNSADGSKIEVAVDLTRNLSASGNRPIVAVQSLAELHRILVRKGRSTPGTAAAIVQNWRKFSEVVASDEPVFTAALELASDHLLSIYDAIILAAAVQSRCDLLLSEDLQNGFTWRGVTVADPFAEAPDSRLAKLLG